MYVSLKFYGFLINYLHASGTLVSCLSSYLPSQTACSWQNKFSCSIAAFKDVRENFPKMNFPRCMFEDRSLTPRDAFTNRAPFSRSQCFSKSFINYAMYFFMYLTVGLFVCDFPSVRCSAQRLPCQQTARDLRLLQVFRKGCAVEEWAATIFLIYFLAYIVHVRSHEYTYGKQLENKSLKNVKN